MTDDQRVFAPSKVGVDRQRVAAFLRGERVFPMTMELDLTQKCTRNCRDCPYGSARSAGLTLSLEFLDRLFSVLGPHTPGLVLSGGECTSVPHFPDTVALARERGFREIAVITNGTLLDKPEVQDALLSEVTSVRVSLYDWWEEDSPAFLATLRRIEKLRDRIEREGSPLEIAASILTRTEWTHRFAHVGELALKTGIDWLYFHPFCVDWDTPYPRQADQRGVEEAVERLKAAHPRSSRIQFPYERYDLNPLRFSSLHGSHFLIQVGADGVNYAGPECKYDDDYALLDLNEYLDEDFLWHPRRVEMIRAISSDKYRPIGTRHRPPMFSDFLQRCLDMDPGNRVNLPVDRIEFRQPNII